MKKTFGHKVLTVGSTCHQPQYCIQSHFISSHLSTKSPLSFFSPHFVLISPALLSVGAFYWPQRSVVSLCFCPLLTRTPPPASLYPGAEPALDPYHGKCGAVGQGQLHLRGGERVWIHQPHVHPGRSRSVARTQSSFRHL